MLYRYPELDADELRVVEEIRQHRADLRHYVGVNPRRWTGLLARMTRARALRASNSIENIHVSAEDAVAAVDGEDAVEADRATWRAVQGYQDAMTYVLQRSRNGRINMTVDVLLAIHFMITQSDMGANPGNFRPGWVAVRNAVTSEIVHEGIDREFLEPVIDDLVTEINAESDQDILIKAALAHLNLTLLHPFSDGNGRTARCLQTAVLAGDGILAQPFASIEEFIGRNQQEYYAVLAEAGGGGWHPERSCKSWVRFCLKGHHVQLRTLLRRNEEIGRTYEEVATVIESAGLPERAALAVLEAAFGHRVRNASYRVSADISNNLASRDLKALVDAGLLVAEGERRGRHYLAAPRVMELRNRHRKRTRLPDPFDPDAADPRQIALWS